MPIRHVVVRDMGELPQRLAAEVRARRASLRLTQRDLADMAGVSERFVRFVEQGKPSIQLDSLVAVLEILGLELQITARASQASRGAQPLDGQGGAGS